MNSPAEPWKSPRGLAALAAFLLLTWAVAGLGGLATGPNIASWYQTLAKSPWTPPSWLFGPAWTLLYTLMAVAAWLVWRRGAPARRVPLIAFGVQLALNLAWSWIFFAWHQVGLALVEIVLLWGAILWTALMFRRSSPAAAWLLVPYLAWVAYAASLNAAILYLNPR